MCYQHDVSTCDLSDGLPAFFPVFNAIMLTDMQRIVEDILCNIKTELMIGDIELIFGLIPRAS